MLALSRPAVRCAVARAAPALTQFSVVMATAADDLHTASAERMCVGSPSAENLLLFSETPPPWPAPVRRISSETSGAPAAPRAPDIVLTPAAPADPERAPEPEPDPERAPEREPEPESPVLHYLQQALQDLVRARDDKKAPHSIELLARQVALLYGELPPAQQLRFFQTLAARHGVDHAAVQQLAGQLAAAQAGQLVRAEEALSTMLQPDYVWIFKQLGRTESGVKFLVDMRAHLLRVLGALEAASTGLPALRALATALKDLIALWFSVGFLQLERVTWASPCAMLEKVSEYEAVHPVRNWTDLKRRVGPYRRCFVFTHHAMPAEPVVVLHTALSAAISASIQDIVRKPRRFSLSEFLQSGTEEGMLQEEDPSQIKAAVFYSISSTQKGLQGIELGNYLIKRVVRELQAEFPQLEQFSSLSPIPGFKGWLTAEINKAERGECGVLTPAEWRQLAQLSEAESAAQCWRELRRLVASCTWLEEPASPLCQLMEAPLMRLCARYLYTEKRRGFALDSVGNFHLRNGAVMWRLNWRADLTPRGLTNSCGIMVNYRYFLAETQQNSEQYLSAQTIRASEQIRQMADQADVCARLPALDP